MIGRIQHPSVLWFGSLSVFLSPFAARADDIRVPEDRSSIQAAIDNARDEDVITVAPGVYSENISFPNKAIVLTSSNPQDAEVVAGTVILGDGVSPTITFAEPVGPATVLRGFTIESRARSTCNAGDLRTAPARGVANIDGGRNDGPSPEHGHKVRNEREKVGGRARQIMISGASPTIEYCRIVDGDSNFQTAAILCAGGSAVIRECAIVLPRPNEPGRLVASVEGTPSFHQCRVIEGTRDTWTYQVDGTPVPGTETNVDWRPDTATGIVYGEHRRSVALGTRSATSTTNAASSHGAKDGEGNVLWVAWDPVLGEVLYFGNNVREAVNTTSRYIDFTDNPLWWPFIPGLDGRAPRPGGLGFGPPPFLPPGQAPPPGGLGSPQSGVWTPVTPFPPGSMVPGRGGAPGAVPSSTSPTPPGGSPIAPPPTAPPPGPGGSPPSPGP